MKRAQMEIMGLAVIVILLALGLLFVLRFMILDQPSNLRQSYTQTQLGANLLNAMLKTSTDCRGNTISELLQDCAVYASSPLSCFPEKNSCYYANETIKIILNETLAKQGNRSYSFVAYLDLPDPVMILGDKPILNGDCLGEKEAAPQPLPTIKGNLMIRLEICS